MPEFEAFEALVRDKGRRELECRPYLKHAERLLVGQDLRSTARFYEVRSYAGDADLIIVADVVTDTLEVEPTAFFWELKAPQCYLFEYDDNKNRCRPTIDLIKAENQLLHYVEEAVGNESTRIRLGVKSSKDIRAGGIIIGTNDTMLYAPKDPRDTYKAAMALRLRRERLYRTQGIRVLVWDRVLDDVRPTRVL